MSNSFISQENVTIDMEELETVYDYIYLRQAPWKKLTEINMPEEHLDKTALFLKVASQLFEKFSISLFCLHKLMLQKHEYYSKTLRKHQTTKRSMERCMLGFTRRDRKLNR